MIKHRNILIKNIYYMLCYVFQNLSTTCSDVDVESFENTGDLFAVILYNGVSSQIKRGLYQEYEEQSEILSTIRGKINISQTIKQNCLSNKKLLCEFDEFTKNSYLNKLLKSTLELLLYRGEITLENKKLLKKVLLYFQDIECIDLKRVEWNQLAFHKNNISYKLLINVCYLVVHGLLMTTECGNVRLNKYLDDIQMHRLYEKFVLEYYRKHYPTLNAGSKLIKWDTETLEFLPQMKTDITLTYGDKTLIIDTKFYSRSMQVQFDKESYISGNLYQIFTYVKNLDSNNTGNVSGMLLYAKTEHENLPELDKVITGNKISVKSLDLNTDFEEIKEKLNSIADEFIGKKTND